MVPQLARDDPARTTRRQRPATLTPVTAIIGGLGAAVLWAAATLCSSRSSRMLGSRVVLGWVMVVGVVVGLPIAVVSPGPATLEPIDARRCSGSRGSATSSGSSARTPALRIGKVSIVAPIVATEGAVAARHRHRARRRRRRRRGPHARRHRGRRGPVHARARSDRCRRPATSTSSPTRSTTRRRGQAARPIDPTARPPRASDPSTRGARRCFAIGAALFFGVGLVAAGRAASLVPVAWVALSARLVGIARRRHPARRSRAACASPGWRCRWSSSPARARSSARCCRRGARARASRSRP